MMRLQTKFYIDLFENKVFEQFHAFANNRSLEFVITGSITFRVGEHQTNTYDGSYI